MKIKIRLTFLALLLLLLMRTNCVKTRHTINHVDDLQHATISVMTGSTGEILARTRFPAASIKSFDNLMDAVAALRSDQVDAVITGFPTILLTCKYNADMTYLPEPLDDERTALAVRKTDTTLLVELNRIIVELRQDGTLEQMQRRWLKTDPSPYEQVIIPLVSGGEVLRVGTCATIEPFSFMDEERNITGHEGELARRIGLKLGRPVVFTDMSFAALIPALQSGKIDLIASGMTATEERAKMVAFTDPYYRNAQYILLKKQGLGQTPVSTKAAAFTVFREGVVRSFYSNIILEKRYLLILDGLKITVVISLLSSLLGSLIGGVICFMRMSRRRLMQLPARIYISLLRGTPVLVLLMIIFYVILASVDIDPVIVAVIAFGLNFGAYAAEIFRTSISGIDRGQTEAGIAMGFSKLTTFIYIVAPQAIRQILPVYKGEVISLVKMTSIVGYIAVQDLTKASDIIRSRTFDAFFPLIMVAVLYFGISWLLMLLMDSLERAAGPKIKPQNWT